MENYKIENIPDFEDTGLQELVNCLKKSYMDNQTNFAKICFSINQIWSYCKNQYFPSKDKRYYNAGLILSNFGFEPSKITRYRQCFERFVQGTTYDNVFIKTAFNGFSPSKLFELLALSYKTLEKALEKNVIRPEMTVKEIRAYIKSLKENGNEVEVLEDENLQEDEIEMAYNPAEYYDFAYFEKKNKKQLINIVWELQKEYQKLKNKK